MQITLIALGSRGDVLPCVALGGALQGAGHEVRFATFEGFRELVAAHGLAFHPIRGDAQAMMLSGGGLALAESGQSVPRMAVGVMRSFGAMAQDYARDLAGLASVPTDLIVNQLPGGLYGRDLAEVLGVPMVAVAVMPLVPTRTAPMLAFPSWPSSLPGYNLATHWLAYQIVWQAFRPTISRWRREVLVLGKAPLWGVFGEAQRRMPVLNGFSRHVVPRPPDWGDQVQVTGYWFPEDRAWQPPEDLVRFLEEGPPPVFVGFGSMPVRDVEGTTALVLAGSGASCTPAGGAWGGTTCRSGPFPWPTRPMAGCSRGWRRWCITAARGRRPLACGPGCRRWWCRSCLTSSTGAGGWSSWGWGRRRCRSAS
jgi:sterol 3beta-glucosyltransferase